MMPRWLWHAGAWIAVAAAVQLAALWALPRLIMDRVFAGTIEAASAAGGVLHPPPPDHTQRRVVMPSPDLLYALCVLDLDAGPWRIRADGHRPGAHAYWSIALYAANSDNFHVVGDRDLGGAPLDLWVLRPSGPAPVALPASARSVQAPGRRVLLLMRVLVGDAGRDQAAADAARRTLRCERT